MRAVLSLLINVLCAAGSWTVAYAFWKVGALEVGRSARTKLARLVSLAGIGDVVDIVPLLFLEMRSELRTKLMLQGLVVIILSTTAIVSAPIAHWATRPGSQFPQTNVSGWIPTNNILSSSGFLVLWNTTIERLNSAGFPYDQLPDFLPDNSVDWKYRASEWNSSWSASCRWTNRTAIQLEATGIYHDGDVFGLIPGIKSVFPAEYFTGAYNISQEVIRRFAWGRVADAIAFFFFQSYSEAEYKRNNDTGRYQNSAPFNLTLAAFHLRNASISSNSGDPMDVEHAFGPGPISQAWYTVATCEIKLARTDLSREERDHIVFPWAPTNGGSTVGAISSFYKAGLQEQSYAGGEVYIPSGPDLFRFYQTYLISKDSSYKTTVWRQLSASVETVELAVPLLAMLVLYMFLLCAGLAWFVVVKKLPDTLSVPRSKIDWMMQGGREAAEGRTGARLEGDSWTQLRLDFSRAEYGGTESDERKIRPCQTIRIVDTADEGRREWADS